ncbi:hypothetical protein FQR65_LT01065 [Abscondita terminalis]|nr:hypothetical protein FQR65_LT01065 [Abscondita terminalis]
MKLLLVIVALICCEISNISAKSVAVNPLLNKEYEINRSGPPCKCMSSQVCQGEVNSDVQCHPSYIMVCCVIPTKAAP